jgi:3-isopropylmalate dehydrogenase
MTKEYSIGVIPGDGTGPEVVAEGMKVMDAATRNSDFKLNYHYYTLGGDHYLKTGQTLPHDVLEQLKTHDALYLGAIGHPDVRPGILEKEILLAIRFSLDQYINLRPVKLYEGVDTPLKHKGPADIDFVIVRENTEGLYTGSGGFFKKDTPEEIAIQESINTRKGVERCIRFSFDYTRKRNRAKKLTLCGKTNVLTYASNLWERTFREVGQEYPDIKTDYAHVDAITMWMVKNPEWFDVIVTDNLFGDIITDLGAMIQGGLGIACGGNINPSTVSMFEPMGGSAPKYTGKDVINPLAAILSAAMMLDFLGETASSVMIERAVMKALKNDIRSLEAGKMGMGTKEVGNLIVRYLD